MRLHARDPATLQVLYVNAVGVACVAREIDKARTFLAKIEDPGKRVGAANVCEAYGIKL